MKMSHKVLASNGGDEIQEWNHTRLGCLAGFLFLSWPDHCRQRAFCSRIWMAIFDIPSRCAGGPNGEQGGTNARGVTRV